MALSLKHACLHCTVQEKKKAVQFTGLAGGTASGDVILYDVKLGELKWRASCMEG